MDPDVAYKEMFAAMCSQDFETARERALDLRSWMARGGFPPKGYNNSSQGAIAYIDYVLRRTQKETT